MQEIYALWNTHVIILFGITIATLVFCGCLYIYKALKSEGETDKLLLLGFGAVLIGNGFIVFFAKINDLTLPGTFSNGTFYGNYNVLEPINGFLMAIGNVSSWCGYALFVFSLEKVIRKSKFLSTAIIVLNIILVLVVPIDLKLIIVRISYYYNAVIVVLFLYYITINSDINIKSISTFLLFGISFFTFGISLLGFDIKSSNIPLIILPLFLIAGAFLVTLPLMIPPRILSKVVSLWYGYIFIYLIFSILMILIYIYFIYYHAYYQIYSLIVVISFIILNLYLNYRIIKDIKADTPSKTPLPDLLKTFLKPQKLTEEEVSISKEKKVCLVCKNKVGGINFICKNCETFYCQKCYNALKDHENLCWACNSTLDTSKPVKLERNEEEIVTKTKFSKQANLPFKNFLP